MMLKSTIAIVGMGCRFPGATHPDRFWENIKNRRGFVTDVPKERWINTSLAMVANRWQPDRAYSKRAGLIQNFKFNPDDFQLDRYLLEDLDPLHQITLAAGRQAFDSCRTQKVNLNKTGVILAAIALPTDGSSTISRKLLNSVFEKHILSTDYGREKKSLSKVEALAAKVVGLPASLLAMELGLSGGTYTLDAACASSSYALKLACDELLAGRADMMITGGVSRAESLYTQVGFSQLKALSPSGRCAPFDVNADGLVVGEGAGIIVLKRLEDAFLHGDTIYGLIRGIGLSNDLRGNLLAPDVEGQMRAMRAAYASSGWSPLDVDYIECHGTGTPMGDRVELQSLCELWGTSGWQTGQCALGSVKSMIGHLLTAASAAGLIKTILAMQNDLLPPSLNFNRPAINSPLEKSPFRVQTQIEQWPKRDLKTPKRAAVSAFGFGGINAHVLIESPSDDSAYSDCKPIYAIPSSQKEKGALPTFCPVAVVGMQTIVGSLQSLKEFQEAIFNGQTAIGSRSDGRWKGIDDLVNQIVDCKSLPGAYLDLINIHVGEFQIPPNEIQDILPQQLLMLKVAADALLDAKMPLRENRTRMGSIIGIGFDFETTNFHMRWALERQLKQLQEENGLPRDWALKLPLDDIKDAFSPPLNASRTMGALGSIVASRVAREFRLGGPSYVVSAEEGSGMKALEIGVRALSRKEQDAVLIGAVDLCADVRNILIRKCLASFSKEGKISPFDQTADGSVPGEGAVALILKRLDDAIADKNRIYAVLRGVGSASRSTSSWGICSKATYENSLLQAFGEADVPSDTISYIETHGSGIPEEDRVELNALEAFFRQPSHGENLPLIGALSPITGHTGAASGLFSVAKACLGIYHHIIPPLVNFSDSPHHALKQEKFHLPRFAHHWFRNRSQGPRRALVAAMTIDGGCSHAIVEEAETKFAVSTASQIEWERKQPLGMTPYGLFVVQGENPNDVQNRLNDLEKYVLKACYQTQNCLEKTARNWTRHHGISTNTPLTLAIVAKDKERLKGWIHQARIIVQNNENSRIGSLGGIAYSPDPLARKGELAFVYPGSGNHYTGMGRNIGLYWPEVLREMDHETGRLKNQMQPHLFVPTRAAWPVDWEEKSSVKIAEDVLTTIFGQIIHAGVTTRLIQKFGISPKAVIGYSLGESAGFFATGAWPEQGQMLMRMENNDLFKTQLCGPCHAARKIWNIGETDEFEWKVVVINRPVDQVQKVIETIPQVKLLIVNTQKECVIGGHAPYVKAVIENLACKAVYIDGVATVHCETVEPVKDAYHDLHLFPTTPYKKTRYYSCAAGKAYDPTRENAAKAILQQALKGFDFSKTISSAYQDGIRIFVEMGPHSSCSRMIRTILDEQPHLAESICKREEDDYFTLLKLLGNLCANGVKVDFDQLYGDGAYPPHVSQSRHLLTEKAVVVTIGGHCLGKALAKVLSKSILKREPSAETQHLSKEILTTSSLPKEHQKETRKELTPPLEIPTPSKTTSTKMEDNTTHPLIQNFTETQAATAQAHHQFLDFSIQIQKAFGETLAFQNNLLTQVDQTNSEKPNGLNNISKKPELFSTPWSQTIAYPREMCMEFAVGSAAKVLGPEFKEVDTYPVRVRLPDEPLMLVDRILMVKGEKGSLTSGKVVTEHDVVENAWYLDGNRVPVCIAVEAGQADLFLCAYLGIDFKVKGLRTYRLLDAKVTFHRHLPQPGDTIRYEIHIDKFIRQQETYLFLFRFEGFIGDRHLITMTDGCAGFFTQKEVKDSGGIILTSSETAPAGGKTPLNWKPFAPMAIESYSDDQVDALRNGDLAACFGPDFRDKKLAENLCLPKDRMHLIHRVIILEPFGGRYKLGRIVAEADIRPDDWFLTCHFIDDKVMPGTLMYECCAHTLRIYLQRLGWVIDKPGVCYEPKIGIAARLICRGPVTPETNKVRYEVIIKEFGYDPAPYAISDAHMYADDHHIVFFEDMSLTISGVTQHEIEAVWKERTKAEPTLPLFTRQHILEFAAGKPSLAFGEPYRVFDQERFIARLPRPPYSFIDRIIKVTPEPWVLKPDGWVEAQVDVSDDDWYFTADRSGMMPFCVLNEIALQSCGWLAAYAGSALRSQNDLKFRNLGGTGVIHQNVLPYHQTLTMRTRLTKVSEAADMIIENFAFSVLCQDRPVYTGDTYFGFFTEEALSDQKGLPQSDCCLNSDFNITQASENEGILERIAPFTPDECQSYSHPSFKGLTLPAKALLMIDYITALTPYNRMKGRGYISGKKRVDPDEWFFKAHFYQDPVCPGSLGIESFLQLIKFYAKRHWQGLINSHRFELMGEISHRWIYRGQIIPTNRLITVEAIIKKMEEKKNPLIVADGWVSVDDLPIYKMENFGLQLVPRS
jgi:PfaB family protein